ncbi:hypothetical protein BDR06DRAFT_554222 [Suillus hirtellus]|nr:hypothetical protein BDR06DRAFT_554222 [Suillus hirtellus]
MIKFVILGISLLHHPCLQSARLRHRPRLRVFTYKFSPESSTYTSTAHYLTGYHHIEGPPPLSHPEYQSLLASRVICVFTNITRDDTYIVLTCRCYGRSAWAVN